MERHSGQKMNFLFPPGRDLFPPVENLILTGREFIPTGRDLFWKEQFLEKLLSIMRKRNLDAKCKIVYRIA